MEATAVSVGKAVLDAALGYAKSTAAEEMALQLGLERDVGFITDELEMMQSFLMTADEERDRNNDKVLTTWVKQVGNVAYDVEDNLVDFSIQAEREKPYFLGCVPRNLCDRRRIAMEVKELKAKVEDVSNRNKRYRLMTKDGAKPGLDQEKAKVRQEKAWSTAAAMFGIDEAWSTAMDQEKAKVDLRQLILSEEVDLRVIAVWGTSGDLGKTSEICSVFDDPKVEAKFRCRAWVRLTQPFDPKEFLHSLVRQFLENSFSQEHGASKDQKGITVGGSVLLEMKMMEQSDQLVREFGVNVSSNSYLVVIDGLSTIDEWRCIKTYFPDMKNGSRIVVATQQVEIATLCTEQPYQVSELKQLSSDQTLYLFHKKVLKPVRDSAKGISKSSDVIPKESSSVMFTATEIKEVRQQKFVAFPQKQNFVAERQLDRSRTRAVPEYDAVVGRKTEKQKLIELVVHPDDSHGSKVISVWGMGGIGKTTLVRSIYRSQELGGWKCAWATALRPFNRDVLIRYLVLQLQPDIKEDLPGAEGGEEQKKKNIGEKPDIKEDLPGAEGGEEQKKKNIGEKQKKKNIGAMDFHELTTELSILLEKEKCLIVLDDLSSTEEWDAIKHYLVKARRIIITTREKVVGEHCSGHDDRNMFSLKGLEADAALDLFKKKVFKDAANFDLHTGLMDQAKLILKRCDGLPLAISTIGGYLANKPKTATEWRKLNDGLSAELEINPQLKLIKTVLMRSYDGLPYHLKTSFLYLSVFPEDHIIRCKHVLRRWIAEGHSREMHHMTAEQVGEKHFDELVDRSMILPLDIGARGKLHSFQLHDLIREICVSKAREENLVFILEEGCSLGTTRGGAIRHLTISSNWERDKDVMQRMLDLSHVRSLTVFGEWRSFFMSNKMRFLRVLDLEHTTGLRDHHIRKIGEFLHLRYLSLRECKGVLSLPDSMANLGQLQTLDVRGTSIWTLPAVVAKLQKLQYLHASGLSTDVLSGIRITWDRTVVYPRGLCGEFDCCGCFEVRRLARREGYILEDGVSCRHDLCYLYRFHTMLKEGFPERMRGVRIPRGISKLRALHTLGVVNVGRGKATPFEELRGLTQLRKLRVVGVSHTNMEMFWRSIAGHNRLRSLSVYPQTVEVDRQSFEEELFFRGFPILKKKKLEADQLDKCFGGDLWPPRCLESLKMRCTLVKVPEWIHRLPNLFKLQLEEASLSQDDIEIIGTLPNLAVLRLHKDSFEEEHLRFPGSSFRSLLFLELRELRIRSVGFEEEAVPRLEVLQARSCRYLHDEFTGLWFLTNLKEIQTDSDYLKVKVQSQLAEHTTVKRL